jgi:hypothetical protein
MSRRICAALNMMGAPASNMRLIVTREAGREEVLLSTEGDLRVVAYFEID